VIAFDVRHYDSIGSTNDEALRLARGGTAHGTVVHADEQIAGRGRLARRWQSPPGNLYVSIVLRLNLPAARCAEIGFVAALAVADAVETLLPNQLRTTLKWPNDVLLRGGKISGILLENIDDALIVGIGINVLRAPGDVAYKVTTIVDSGGLATVDGTRASLLTALARWLEIWQRDGFPPIRAAWLARAHPPGTPVRLTLSDRLIEGRFADLAPDGSLILETDDGRKQFAAGDVALVARASGRAAPPGATI
jgi:BirA family biotin operon repressor/biotin-[acetyl-CoA-carboxylase] ligase